jgi:predicted TIM-barrel fold metal-dependent hydrolase
MVIDMHAHMGDLRSPATMERKPVTIADLLIRLDEEGIDRAVLLPWPACPEAITFPGLFAPEPDVVSQIRAAAARPDRLIPFGNVDPRWGGNSADTDFGWLLEKYVDLGCVGMGEVSANIPFDDPRVVNLFRQCGERELPVTIESTGPGPGHYGFIDEVGSPHLERLLQQVPDTIVIGHGPGFWAEIGADVTSDSKSQYPRGPVAQEGSLARLFRTYSNLFADLSAMSGHNALTRDPDYGTRFLLEFQDRLMFGTDTCFAEPDARLPILDNLRSLMSQGKLDSDAFEKLTHRNARRVLTRYRPD